MNNEQTKWIDLAQPQDAEEGSAHQHHHRQKRAFPAIPQYLLLKALKSGGGQQNDDLSKAPPQVAQMLQMGGPGFNEGFVHG